MKPSPLPSSYLPQPFPQRPFDHQAYGGMVPSRLIHEGELELRRDHEVKANLTPMPLGGAPVPPTPHQNMYLFATGYGHIPSNPTSKTLKSRPKNATKPGMN